MNVSNKLFPSKNNIVSRRAVAPVIATILLIAIAVVGGGMIFAFSEDSHRYLAISNSPQIDSLEITGFDARDVSVLMLHDGIKANNLASPGDFDGQAGNGLLKGERIAVYVQNNSISTVYFSEVRFAGSELVFVPGDPLTEYGTTFMNPGEFVIATKGTTGVANLSSSAKLQSGQEATFLIELEGNIPIQRDTSFKIVTTNGAGLVGTIYLGHQTGGI
jgi:flagellin-like protein